MVCYICGKLASFRCSVCGRHACNKHTCSTDGIEYFENWLEYFENWLRDTEDYCRKLPHYICDTCFKQAVEYSNTEAQTRYYGIHYCDWHNVLHDDMYLANDKWESKLGIVYCGTCKKQICADSTIKDVTKEIYFHSCNYEGGYSKCEANEGTKLKIITIYLCPICKASIVMYETRFYEAVFKYVIFKKFEYQERVMSSIYRYDNEKHEFVEYPFVETIISYFN